MSYIKKFEEITYGDISLVGGKTASLGAMINNLADKGIVIPTGFAITADGYWYYMRFNNFIEPLEKQLSKLKRKNDITFLRSVGQAIRDMISSGNFPDDLASEIVRSYDELCKHYEKEVIAVAVRSSATAEDLPGASFAGQQETFLNIRGAQELLWAVKQCFASLFTDRAIVYRQEKGFEHMAIGLSVCVQKMVRSDQASAGVIFTIDPETGFKNIVVINAAYGLGEVVVQGSVTPDEFVVHKPTLREGFAPIVKKALGKKHKKIIYAAHSKTQEVVVSLQDQQHFSLSDEEVLSLARMALIIEDYYSQQQGRWVPMDIEWAKDGNDGKLYIVQARPETVHAQDIARTSMQQYVLNAHGKPVVLCEGQSIGQQIATGKVCIVASIDAAEQFCDGDILVTAMTDPDWVPLMKRAAAIVTERGGRTCHAAIVSRELGIPAVVGAVDATSVLRNGDTITVDCSQGNVGYVYKGTLEYRVNTINVVDIPQTPMSLMLNLADPERAFSLAALPVVGVGLARVEFIITNTIKVHPMVAVAPERVTDMRVLEEVKRLAGAYQSVADYVVSSLAQGVAKIAAAFFPRPVIVRFSDFKSNEYAHLLGGSFFEPQEANPMLGLRGASRYYSPLYEKAFELECLAIARVRDVMGLYNLQVMIPFVRTAAEAQRVLAIMAKFGLASGKQELKIIMMCEIPSNVILMDVFSELFDGFSIGSNDLTQMVLGVDRDSSLLASLFDERDQAVKAFIAQAIQGAHAKGKPIGICGQAPSDYPEMADFLIEQGIDSLSLNPDSVLPFLMRYKK